jgi:protein arginine kinase
METLNTDKLVLERLKDRKGEWLDGSGPYSPMVVSSRIRLARNIKDFPFPQWAKDDDLASIIQQTKKAINRLNYRMILIEIERLNLLSKQFLTERFLISNEFAKSKKGVLAVDGTQTIGIMINEEDHLRIQGLASGLQVNNIWERLNVLDDTIGKEIEFAFSPNWGYLTACPTNVGTGIRASIMLHLPALVMTKQIGKVLHAVSQLGLVARGFYGEGTESLGNYFQLSNQITLGRTEEEIIEGIEKICTQIIEHEENAKVSLLKNAKEEMEDKIFRAYATLTHAKIMNIQESMELLSMVRFGVRIGVLKNIPFKVLNELLISIQPAHIKITAKEELSPLAFDVRRAAIIREKLKNYKQD